MMSITDGKRKIALLWLCQAGIFSLHCHISPLGKIGAFLLVLIEYAIPYAMREGLRQYAINLGGFPSARIHNAVVA